MLNSRHKHLSIPSTVIDEKKAPAIASVEDHLSLGKPFAYVLKYFPLPDFWRVCADGWQQQFGADVFSEKFYAGMHAGFRCIAKHFYEKRITWKTIAELHDSAYQFHPKFKHEQYHGIKSASCTFEIALASEHCQYESAVSQEGLFGFARDLVTANKFCPNSDPSNYYPLWQISSKTEILLNPHDKQFSDGKNDIDLKKVHKELATLLEKAREDKESGKGKFKCFIETSGFKQDINIEAISKYLDEFYQNMEKIEKKSTDLETRTEAILFEIAKLLRKLHQSHFFLDGNGRTFIFLLKNFLLLKYLNTLSITMMPAHFAGYSSRELVKEMTNEIRTFQQFNISKALSFVLALKLYDFEDTILLKQKLMETFSPIKVIALAQINEIFIRLGKPDENYFIDDGTLPKVMTLLKETYNFVVREIFLERKEFLKKFADSKVEIRKAAANYGHITTPGAFFSMVKRHDILNDEKYPCMFSVKHTKLFDPVICRIRNFPPLQMTHYNSECRHRFNKYFRTQFLATNATTAKEVAACTLFGSKQKKETAKTDVQNKKHRRSYSLS